MGEVASVIDDSIGRLGVGVVSGGKGNKVGLLGCMCWLDRWWHRGLCLIGICEGRVKVCG
jgi:hypothetical protein